MAAAPRYGARAAGGAASGDAGAEPDHQPGDHPQLFQLDPLAEPLACSAAELDVLSERFRRPHRQPGHADRPCPARKRGVGDQRGLVHPGLRRRRDPAAGVERRSAGDPGAAVVLRLCGLAALVRPAAAQPLAADVRGAFAAVRPGRRQLYQHLDGQAVCPPARRGRLCPRSDGRADRRAP